MEGGGSGKDLDGMQETNGSGGDGSLKVIPPCCLKAMASMPESEAKCHATVVSGWFTESRSCSGYYLLFVSEFCHVPDNEDRCLRWFNLPFPFFSLLWNCCR